MQLYAVTAEKPQKVCRTIVSVSADRAVQTVCRLRCPLNIVLYNRLHDST